MGLDRDTILQLPALTPPPGVEANFVDSYNMRSMSLARNIAIISITTLAVWMRLFTKVEIVKKLHVEDYFILVSWLVLVFAVEVPVMMLQKTKLGAHQWDMTVGEMIPQLYYFHIANSFYCIGILFLKSGINIQCLRIFSFETTSRISRYLLHVLLWLNITVFLVSGAIASFPCRPLRKAWDVTVEGHCVEQLMINFITAIINTISDLLLVFIPLNALWAVSWDKRKKLRISALFGLGLGACICAITRIAPSWSLYRSDDKTYYLELNGALGMLEYFFGLCAACLVVLPKFVKYAADHLVLLRSKREVPKLADEEQHQCRETGRPENPQVITDVEFDELVNSANTLEGEGGILMRHDNSNTNWDARSTNGNIPSVEGSVVKGSFSV